MKASESIVTSGIHLDPSLGKLVRQSPIGQGELNNIPQSAENTFNAPLNTSPTI